jgi:hypothetical protein
MATFPCPHGSVTVVVEASITPLFCNKIPLRDRCSKSQPLGHRLQDSTHTSFGVVTTGFIFNFAKSALFKVEGSAFNGHEPNEERWSIQLAPLDSWSFRVSAAPTRSWTAQ